MLPSRLDSMRDNHDLGPFITVTNDAMDLEIAFHNNTSLNSSHNPPPRTQPSSSSQPSVPSSVPKAAGGSSSLTVPMEPLRVNHSDLYCNICKNSDVPALAWPESPGFGLALGGLGLRKS